MFRFLDRILNSGSRHFSSKQDLQKNRIVNMLLLFFILVLLFLDFFVTILYFFRLMPADPAKYDSYFWPYFLPLFGINVVVAGSLFLKNLFGRLIPFSLFALACGHIFVAIYSILLGPESNFSFFMFILLPFPFFVLTWNRRTLLLFSEAAMIIASIAVSTWVQNHPGYYPFEPKYIHIFRILVWGATLATITLSTFHFWQETQKAEVKLTDAFEKLRERDEILQLELDFAADIQAAFYPERSGKWKNLEYSAIVLPAGKVSGDIYDVAFRDDDVYFLIADISGHGIPAAFLTIVAKQAFEEALIHEKSPEAIFKRMNLFLCQKIKTQDYLTAFLIRIRKNGECTYVNGSHTNPIHYRKAKDSFFKLDTDGIMLGALENPDIKYTEKSMNLGEGDMIFLYTDGITEQKNSEGLEFGVTNLVRILKNNLDTGLSGSAFAVIEAVHDHRKHEPISDDISILAIRFNRDG